MPALLLVKQVRGERTQTMDIRKLVESLLGVEAVAGLVPGRILAVDDDDGNLAVLEDLLEDDYEVITSDSPEAALGLFETQHFDLVISDQRMPGMTGVQMLSRIRERAPDTARIIVSAYSDSSELMDAINTGQVYRYVLKPWDPSDLEAVVRQALDHRFRTLAIRRLVETLRDKNVALGDTLQELKDAQEKVLHAARLATIGQLSSSLTHELKNHVGGIRVAYEMLKSADVPPTLQAYVDLGNRSARSLMELVESLNAYVRRGGWELELVDEDLGVLVEETLRICRMDRRCKERDLHIVKDSDVPRLRVDTGKIRQVLVNLLRNALDATGPADRIEIAVSRSNGNSVAITVHDTGEGIAEENLKKIFKPFYTTKEKGLGLGMDICKQIIEAHGGVLAVDSVLGNGTTVSVVLPIRAAS
jgi:signal transduction histidine kinase